MVPSLERFAMGDGGYKASSFDACLASAKIYFRYSSGGGRLHLFVPQPDFATGCGGDKLCLPTDRARRDSLVVRLYRRISVKKTKNSLRIKNTGVGIPPLSRRDQGAGRGI